MKHVCELEDRLAASDGPAVREALATQFGDLALRLKQLTSSTLLPRDLYERASALAKAANAAQGTLNKYKRVGDNYRNKYDQVN